MKKLLLALCLSLSLLLMACDKSKTVYLEKENDLGEWERAKYNFNYYDNLRANFSDCLDKLDTLRKEFPKNNYRCYYN